LSSQLSSQGPAAELPAAPVSELQRAMDTYRQTFGHAVPGTVAMLFSSQPGPLLMEIRQAIALGRPVPAWSVHAKRVSDSPDRWTQVA
jgi:hypothetical protein